MKKLIVKTGTEKDFFNRGKSLARLADSKNKLPAEFTVSFEDPSALLRMLSAGRLNLFRTIKSCPASPSSPTTR